MTMADELGSISGHYFRDDNNNGVDDDGFAVAGKMVSLFGAGGTTTVATTTTDSLGDYSFTGLEPGTYVLAFENSFPWGFIASDVGGDDTIDSDVIDAATGRTESIVVTAGAAIANVDAGVAPVTGELSGRYFCDDDGDGLEGSAEPGIAGVTVELLHASGVGTGITTTTGANGLYAFAGLDAGTYGVKFTDTVSGKTLTTPNVGSDDTIDSDAIDQGGGVPVIPGIAVVAGQITADNDAGVRPATGSLSGRYFCDENGDGVDNGEPGVAGKQVALLAASGVIATTTTDSDGGYAFTNVLAGDYVMAFEDSLAEGKRFVQPDQGGDDTIDSDVIDPATGRTAPVTVVVGADTSDVDAGVFDQAFTVKKAISNIVVYLDCDGLAGDRITKVKFDDFDFRTKELHLSQVEDALAAVGFEDCDVLGLTVKAGNNKGGFGPGEGQYFDVDLTDSLMTGTRAKAGFEFDADDAFGFV